MKNTGLALFAIVAFALPFVGALVLSSHRALGSVRIVALFGAGWGTGMAKAIRSRSIHGFAWRVALTIFIFNFFRNDLFIAGGALWVFALYGIPVEIYRRMKLGGARISARAGRDRAPAEAQPAS